MSYSQLNQDLQVVKFYQEKKNGFFLDIGAYDGKVLSNTFLLEKEYDWKGICIEPLPEAFEKCRENRKAKCYNVAAYSSSGITLNFTSHHLYSGITEKLNCFQKMLEHSPIFSVLTETVNDILEKEKAPSFIEYMSLDTEGSELEILKGIDFSKYTFGLIDVEHNFVEKQRKEIRDLLEMNNYFFVNQNQWDDCYCHVSLKKNMNNAEN